MGGGGSLTVPLKFLVVTEKTVFAVPEASIGFHTDCSFSYILSHLPGHLGEYLALTGARLNGKEMVAAGLATHFVPSEKLAELEKRLISLNSGNEMAVKSVIEEFSLDVKPDEESILNKQSTINKCFDKDSVEEILKSFEAEASIEGNGWINAVLKGLKRSSPTGLKITLRSDDVITAYESDSSLAHCDLDNDTVTKDMDMNKERMMAPRLSNEYLKGVEEPAHNGREGTG